MSSVAIFGAGRIARGFLAHLLSLSGMEFFFIEKDLGLVDLLNRNGKYGIHVMGHEEKDYVVRSFKAYHSDDLGSFVEPLSRCDLVLTSVGGQNLPALAPPLAAAIELRSARVPENSLNIITCENWVDPARKLRAAIGAELPGDLGAYFAEHVGVAESVVLRSATDAEPERVAADPLVVNVQDYWQLHIDSATLVGTLPDVRGFDVRNPFAGMLTRKLYTYNAANGTASYLGYLRGHSRIDQAVEDPEILEILMRVYEETSMGLAREFGIPYDEEYAFSMTSLAKLRNRDIVDFVARNARDPIRKLGPEDRLVGPSLIAIKYGAVPIGLATAIAAAMFYDDPADARAVELDSIRREKGIDHILDSICGLTEYPQFKAAIKGRIEALRAKGWIKVTP